MADMRSRKSKGGDEENSAFGLPAKTVDHKSGVHHEVAKQGVEKGHNRRRRPREEKDIPQETLAARIGKIRKGG
jgi:hypothetical protein